MSNCRVALYLCALFRVIRNKVVAGQMLGVDLNPYLN